MPHKKLFIPGPTEVHPDVLKAMATPMIGHRSSDYSELQKRITEKVQKLAFTANPDPLLRFLRQRAHGRRHPLLHGEAGHRVLRRDLRQPLVRDCPGQRRGGGQARGGMGQGLTAEMIDQYLSTGKYDCATLTHSETSTGVMNHLAEFAPVFRKYPDVVWCIDAVSSFGGVKVEVDALGVDVMVTSSQKCLGLPPGLSLATMSPKAEKRAQSVKNRGYYFDLLQLLQFIREKNFQYPSTMSISHLFALDVQMDRITEGRNR